MNRVIDPQEAYDSLLFYIFTTAVEGGINYWCDVTDYSFSQDGKDLVRDFNARVCEVETNTFHTINLEVIERGFTLACTEWLEKVYWSTSYPPDKKHFFTPPRYDFDLEFPWDFDAGDADAIVQIGLFGEVVYG